MSNEVRFAWSDV